MSKSMFRIFATYRGEENVFTFETQSDANSACGILRTAGFDVTDYHEYELSKIDEFQDRVQEIKEEIKQFLKEEAATA